MISPRQSFAIGFLSLFDLNGRLTAQTLSEAVPTASDYEAICSDISAVWGDLRGALRMVAGEAEKAASRPAD